MPTFEVTFTTTELQALLKAAQISKNTVGQRIVKQAPGRKLDELRAEYEATADAIVAIENVLDEILLGKVA